MSVLLTAADSMHTASIAGDIWRSPSYPLRREMIRWVALTAPPAGRLDRLGPPLPPSAEPAGSPFLPSVAKSPASLSAER